MHNLATINGEIAFAYQGATPWHMLGTKLPHMKTIAEAMAAAKLNDWNVGLRKMFFQHGDAYIVCGERLAVIRGLDNAVLGTVGTDYRVVQLEQAFAIGDTLCSDFGCTIEAAGAINGGRRAWVLLKYPGDITVTPGDDVRGYFLIMTSHDGSTAIIGRFTPIRVVCQNTLNAAMNHGVDSIRVPHTVSADRRLDEAAKIVKQLAATLKQTGDTFAALAAKKLDPDAIVKYIEAVFPQLNADKPSNTITDRRATVAKLVFTGKGADLAGSNATTGTSTAWGVYNAVTEYFDHMRPAEAKSDGARLQANTAAIFGNANLTKVLALQKARELIAA